jgi:heme exporter protein C
MIAKAPYESTMGLIQKIFYVHVPCWWAAGAGVCVCDIASVMFLIRSEPAADRLARSAAELTVVFGLCGLVTGPLWARKAWGVWWQWDAKLTIALLLEMIFVAYLLVRMYGGPGSDKLAAAVGIFGLAIAPFVYAAVNISRTVHPLTSVVPTLEPGMRGAFWFCLDELYLAQEES